ncbi:MAG TPA: rubrerythrin [candidate division Zixibacteria bacterium]|nr:rubrerythrin [candidate division Zixibacteria bacterium]
MQDVFDFAMQMEQDGRDYYEEMASKTKIPALKKILTGLADDEKRHYQIFKNLKEQHSDQVSQLSEKSTTIMSDARNIFEQLSGDEVEVDTAGDAIEVWEHAQEIEKKSEDFYREKAGVVPDKTARDLLNKIADEEHKHWALIESVMQFLHRPDRWLEDAEWNHLEEY